MCGAGLCHSWIFGVGIELFILSILMGLGAFLNALMCWIWGDTGEAAVTADRRMTGEAPTISRVA